MLFTAQSPSVMRDLCCAKDQTNALLKGSLSAHTLTGRLSNLELLDAQALYTGM